MRRKKNLLVLLGCLAVLVGITLAATKWNPENTETTAAQETTIFTLDTASVEKLQWTYSEELSFVRTEDGWEYETDPVFPLDETFLEEALTALAQITSSRTIEGVTDWDQYGLEAPLCSITVTAGESYTLSIGEETGLGSERYFSLGDGNVYLVDETIIDSFSYGLYDLLTYETIPTMTTVTDISLQSQVQNYQITKLENSGKAYSDEYVWFMGEQVLDNELTQVLIEKITAVSWAECVEYNAQDMSQYGLDIPEARVTCTYLDEEEKECSFTLEIGDAKDDQRYARIKGSKMVYLIDGELCQTMMYTTAQELLPDEVILLDWDSVTAVEIGLDGASYQITKDTQTVTDSEGNTSEETVYLLGDTEVDGSSLFDALDGMASTGYATGAEPAQEAQLRILFGRQAGTVELVFYPYDSSRCLVVLNGDPTVFVSREDVTALAEEITELLQSE